MKALVYVSLLSVCIAAVNADDNTFKRARATISKAAGSFSKLNAGTSVPGLMTSAEVQRGTVRVTKLLATGARLANAAAARNRYVQAKKSLSSQIRSAKKSAQIAVAGEQSKVQLEKKQGKLLRAQIQKLKQWQISHDGKTEVEKVRATLKAQSIGGKAALRKAKQSVTIAQIKFDNAQARTRRVRATLVHALKKAKLAEEEKDVDSKGLRKSAKEKQAEEHRAEQEAKQAKANLQMEKTVTEMQTDLVKSLDSKDRRLVSLANEADNLRQQIDDRAQEQAALELKLELARQEQADVSEKKAMEAALKMSRD